MDDIVVFFKEIMIPIIIAFIILTITIIVPVAFIDNYHRKFQCDNYEIATGRETKWFHFDDCYVNAGDVWLTLSEYRAAIIAKEGLK